PDYLPLVLDFADLSPRGRALLRAHRADLELLRRALEQAGSPYADVVAAVCAHLPGLGRRELDLVRRAWESGPPAEEVGLEPFAPPEYLAGYAASGNLADDAAAAPADGREARP
ncbi:MAG: nitrate reductase molybdenum cofactor assembly chaperone, partial [Streptosporangiaceae bacterium]